jgi:phosphate starvation-inducible membrane PsiE
MTSFCLKFLDMSLISFLVTDFFFLAFRINSASLKGNKYQLHKEEVLIFFLDHFELNSQSIIFN